MRLEQAHLMHLWNKLFSSTNFICKIHCFKNEPFVEFEIRLTLKQCIFQRKVRRAYSMGALDAPAQN